jgi:hypothetical protein
MQDFKFFQKGTLDIMDGDVRATASFNADTPEGYYTRRRLYHTAQSELYNRLRNPFNNNEMERYYYDRQLGRFETFRPTLNQEEVTRRINGGGTDNQIKLYQATRVTTVNPKWWMKIKMFLQKIKINAVIETHSEAIGIFFIAVTVTFIFGLMIAKVLNVW